MKNKLYKYLPFDIQIEQKEYGLQLLTPYVLHALSENPEIEVKPVLRLFEHLTRELPLTKAAAEIVGIKEGGMINSFYEFCKILINYDFNGKNSKFKLETDMFHQKAANTYVNSYYTWLRIELFNPYLIGYSILELKQNPEIVYGVPNPVRRRINVEKAFDFLRSMKFNLDFKEGEYVKLEE